MEEQKKGPDEKQIARDTLCAPIARKALALCLEKKVPFSDAPEAKDLQAVTEAVITEMTLADVCTKDVQWIGKLMVQGVANAVVSTYETVGIESGDERYHSAAYAILEILVNEDVSLGMMTVEETKKAYEGVGAKLVAMIQELGLNAVEVDHVFGLLSTMAHNVGGNVHDNVQKAATNASCKLFGVDFLDDVTISKIIEVQKQ